MTRIGLALVFVASCAADEPASDDQRPPTSAAKLEAWLADGSYTQWRCEPAAHDGRTPSPHGRTRVCNNDVLAAAVAGPFPVDSASVKELVDASGAIIGHSVDRKLDDGSGGASWYWFEITNGNVGVDGRNIDTCVGCHAAADDFVFTKVALE